MCNSCYDIGWEASQLALLLLKWLAKFLLPTILLIFASMQKQSCFTLFCFELQVLTNFDLIQKVSMDSMVLWK